MVFRSDRPLGPFTWRETLDHHCGMALVDKWLQRRANVVDWSPVPGDYIHLSLQYLQQYCSHLARKFESCDGSTLVIFLQIHHKSIIIQNPDNGNPTPVIQSEHELCSYSFARDWNHHLVQTVTGSHRGGSCIPNPTDVCFVTDSRHPILSMYFRCCDGLYRNVMRKLLSEPSSTNEPTLVGMNKANPVATETVQKHFDTIKAKGLQSSIPVYVLDGKRVQTAKTVRSKFTRWAPSIVPHKQDDECNVRNTIDDDMEYNMKRVKKIRGSGRGRRQGRIDFLIQPRSQW